MWSAVHMPNEVILLPFHAGFLPDATTVFQKTGDLIKLGEWEMPADAQLTRFGSNESSVRQSTLLAAL
jgi:hypothetical protein